MIAVEENMVLHGNTGMIFQYTEMMIQLGYITMFAPAFPLAAMFAFLNNLWEISGIISRNLEKIRGNE